MTAYETRPLDPRDAAEVQGWHQAVEAALALDYPAHGPNGAELTVGGIDHPVPGEEVYRLVSARAGQVAGAGLVQLPQEDNTDAAYLDVCVAPGDRRRGVGSELLRQAADLARAHGRDKLFADTGDDTSPAWAFAMKAGMTPALRNALSLLAVDDLTFRRCARLEESAARRARSRGYALVSWSGPPSPEACADIGLLEQTLSTDAPLGYLEVEPERWAGDRVAGAWQALTRRGIRTCHAAARDEGTGRLVAWTVLVTCPSVPEYAGQWGTVVAPEHRGHRLGMWVKTANLRQLRGQDPRPRMVRTFNATSNRHMLAVNEEMGFRRAGLFWSWQGSAGGVPGVSRAALVAGSSQ